MNEQTEAQCLNLNVSDEALEDIGNTKERLLSPVPTTFLPLCRTMTEAGH